jgi:hypothetical protein
MGAKGNPTDQSVGLIEVEDPTGDYQARQTKSQQPGLQRRWIPVVRKPLLKGRTTRWVSTIRVNVAEGVLALIADLQGDLQLRASSDRASRSHNTSMLLV